MIQIYIKLDPTHPIRGFNSNDNKLVRLKPMEVRVRKYQN